MSAAPRFLWFVVDLKGDRYGPITLWFQTLAEALSASSYLHRLHRRSIMGGMYGG